MGRVLLLAKIKIISNPYHRTVSFQNWNGAWAPISSENNPNSALLARRFTEGFFPFKARQIVDELLTEYGSADEANEIEFEGPDDEWVELVRVCKDPSLCERVKLVRGGRSLANARDILPFVRTEFDGIYSIIAGQLDGIPDAQELLKKFRDASSDIVPVCVVGNYSSGKSTFINALLGIELLPSGDKPLTSRVSRIERSEQPDRASVKMSYMGEPLSVSFGERSTAVDFSGSGCPLYEEILAAVPQEDAEPIVDRVRKVLGVINEHRTEEGEHIGDLIEVKVPYVRDSWMGSKDFVIFDTPGSNSNSNADHLRVLQDAMREMSDGLPIYVTEYSAIDSNDNAELYDEIKQIEALDERFAMVVVNKADTAYLPEGNWSADEVDDIMNTAVVRNLYAQGVYFVSSVMGLGAKMHGRLSDRHYDRCYRQLLESYSNPDDRYYTTLYKYDLMPEQLRRKMLEDAAACCDTVLANSGLYSIECGVEDFASKYSVYNKCFRSDDLLRELIEKTDDALQDVSERLDESRRLGESDLDESRANRLTELRAKAGILRDETTSGYLPYMNQFDYLADASLSMEDLRAWEREFSEYRKREALVDEKDRAAEASREAAVRRLGERFESLVDSRDFLGLGSLATGFMNDVSKAFEAHAEEMDARRLADSFTSADLLERIRDHFDKGLESSICAVERRSKEYWKSSSEKSRAALLGLVSEGEGIEAEGQESLRGIIMNFRPLTLDDADPEIMDIRVPFDPNKLWKAPVYLQHNLELSRRIMQWRSVVEPAHEDGYLTWLEDLVGELEENIVDLNPELKKKLEFIKKNERELADLQIKRDRLRRAEERVSRLMAWQGEV